MTFMIIWNVMTWKKSRIWVFEELCELLTLVSITNALVVNGYEVNKSLVINR